MKHQAEQSQGCLSSISYVKLYTHLKCNTDRSSHRRCSVKKDVLRNFPKFTGKHLRQSLFFNKLY